MQSPRSPHIKSPSVMMARTIYSSKIFIGAVPPGTNEQLMKLGLSKFGEVEITWPNKENTLYPSHGYVFAIYKNPQSVNTLLSQCVISENKYLLNLPEIQQTVQIRPYALDLATFVVDPLWFRFIRLSVFIGGLPRSCTARDLAAAVSINYGPILHASIELDYYHCYPKGAARIVFRRVRDYIKAAQVGHVMLEIANNSHRVEMKPFFYHGISCEICSAPPITTDYFCTSCLKYLCKNCWSFVHKSKLMAGHRPMQDAKRELPSSCRNAVCVTAN